MKSKSRVDKFEYYMSTDNVDCHFDQRTGIMKIFFDDSVDVNELPTDAEFMELFAQRRKGQTISGLAIFPRETTTKN